MPEWILRIIAALLGRKSAAQDRLDDANERHSSALRKEADAIREAYRVLMADHIAMANEMRQDFTQQLELLREEVASLASALEKERHEHKECRRRLAELEAAIKTLKGQVEVIKQQRIDSDNAGS